MATSAAPGADQPLPVAVALAVAALAVSVSALFAASGDVWTDLNAFVVAACGTPALVAGVRHLTGRTPANELTVASPRVRALAFAVVALAASVAAAVGMAPEDAAIGALPLVFIAPDLEVHARATSTRQPGADRRD